MMSESLLIDCTRKDCGRLYSCHARAMAHCFFRGHCQVGDRSDSAGVRDAECSCWENLYRWRRHTYFGKVTGNTDPGTAWVLTVGCQSLSNSDRLAKRITIQIGKKSV
jgi:hypothetical protein